MRNSVKKFSDRVNCFTLLYIRLYVSFQTGPATEFNTKMLHSAVSLAYTAVLCYV